VYNHAFSSTSKGTQWPAKRKHGRKGAEKEEQKELRATGEQKEAGKRRRETTHVRTGGAATMGGVTLRTVPEEGADKLMTLAGGYMLLGGVGFAADAMQPKVGTVPIFYL
jgi:hypothetical protein